MNEVRIDHAVEARRLQGGARDIVRAINGDPALQPHMAAIIMLDDARLEAQLAIAEQLRLGNLIAYSSMLDHQYQMANDRGEADIKFTVDQEGLDASLARKHAAQVEIAAALGVSNE